MNKNENPRELKETSINYLDVDRYAVVSTPEKKLIGYIRRVIEECPDLIEIRTPPEDNGGYMVARVPKEWVVIRRPKRVTMSEERKAICAENLKKYRDQKKIQKSVDCEDGAE